MKGFDQGRPQTCPPPATTADKDGDTASTSGKRRRKRLDSIKVAAGAVTAARMMAWVTPESSWHDLKDGRNQGWAAIWHNRRATRRLFSKEEYNSLASRYFGSGSSGGRSWFSGGSPEQFHSIPEITPSERYLVRAAGRRKMPPVRKIGKAIRPSSAQAKLQTGSETTSSLYGSGVAASEEVVARPQTAAPGLYGGGGRSRQGASQQQQNNATVKSQSENDVPKVEQRVRRLTVGAVDGISQNPDMFNRGRMVSNGDVGGLKIEERINLEHLYRLKRSFGDADEDGSGTLNLEEFKKVLKSSLGLKGRSEEEIIALFMKIDSSSVGQIGWDEFCTYMQLEYEEKEDAYLRQKEVDIHTPANTESMPHRDSVLRITNMADGTFAAVSQDGTISFWNGSMGLKRAKSVMADQNHNRQKPKWVTDFVIMSHFTKLILSTGDREIQFYELSTFEPYCQVTGLETTPLKLDYSCVGQDECLIMYGDSDGCINIIIINGTGETLRTWKKMPKTDGIASVTLEKVAHSRLTRFLRWSVHGDWVGELRYYDDIRSIISCSNHENTALVIGCTVGSTHVESQLKEIKEYTHHPETADRKLKIAHQNYAQARKRLDVDQTCFRIHKGVKTFDFSKKCNIIVTGGMDRIVRIWNPYVPSKPTGMLRGHNAPIFGLFIAEEEHRVYSLSQDKTIKVWDIKDQACMLTIRPKTHRIRGDLQACHYNRPSKGFAIATDHMALLTHRPGRAQQRSDVYYTHKEPVHCAKYNPSFKHVVTCSDASVVKLWDFETGNSVFEFSQAHDSSAITTMTFDNTGRRLITGARDGRLKVWNYNNGHCLKKLEREEGYDEVTDVVYIEMNKNRYIISVGWDRHINCFTDTNENIRHVQYPQPRWPDDVKNGHKEDILAIAACPPNMLATSSYDGDVIVWNLVSGHIYCHLRAPNIKELDSEDSDDLDDHDNSICSLVFLPTRKANKDTVQLIAGGPRGRVHFWNVFNGGSLFASFVCSPSKHTSINSMQLTSDDCTLFIGDSIGYVSVWDLDGYCLNNPEDEPPPALLHWRAHIEMITSMNLVEDNNVIITSSLDCTVRLWTTEGHYIGTLGQPTPWDIYDPSTYTYPMVPYDVLVDPLSMPIHPVLETVTPSEDSPEDSERQEEEEEEEGNEEEKQEDEMLEENGEHEEKDGRKSATSFIMTSYMKSGREMFHYDDEMIAAELKTKPFKHASGKRLRHEQLKPAVLDKGGPNAYQTLKCFDLDDTPPLAPPTRSRDKSDDLFGFSGF